MDQLRLRATTAARSKELAQLKASRLQASRIELLSNLVKIVVYGSGAHANQVQWTSCGIISSLYRKDIPRLTHPGKHTDGVCIIGTRTGIKGEFIAKHAQVTYYERGSKEVEKERMMLGPEEFFYNPRVEKERLEEMKRKDKDKITHHEEQLMNELEVRNAENEILDFSCTFVPSQSRPKSGRSCPLFDLNEWVSDLSESSSDESDISSSDEEGFSMLLDSVILGKGGKKEERRRRREERDIRRKRKSLEKEKRAKEREARRLAKQNHFDRKKRKAERQRRKEEQEQQEQEAIMKNLCNNVIEARHNSVLYVNNSKNFEDEKDDDGESSEDDYVEWSPPKIEEGDELELCQFPDAHDSHHPTCVKVKVYKIKGAKIYYRVDPTEEKEMYRFFPGAVLIKLFPKEEKWRVMGMHVGKAEKIEDKALMWCHQGYLLTYALQRMRKDINEMENLVKAEDIEEKVQPVNYRKMQMQAARKDLDVIMQAHKDRAGLEKAVETVGEIDGARARDLLLNAEATGIEAVMILMKTYDKHLEIQTGAMRTCVRIMLGTHIQHGRYLSQVEAIKEFGSRGIVRHTVQAMRLFLESPNFIIHALWLLSLMSQNVENARAAGEQGANEVIVKALKTFAVFGKANPQGQKWGCACVVNMAKNSENRKKMEKVGVLEAVASLLDNSKSVMMDAKCQASVIGAIIELARKPNFDARRVLVDRKVHIVILDARTRVEEQREALLAEENKSHDDETTDCYGNKDEDDEIEYKKFTHAEIDFLLEACEECMEVLSFNIPSNTWHQALSSRKFEIDWNLIASAYHLDLFGRSEEKECYDGSSRSTMTSIANTAKKFRKNVKASAVESMRAEYSLHRPSRRSRSPSPDNSVSSLGSQTFASLMSAGSHK
mmetsp:Transcript_15477/g.31883  ORF Transcript_15477/g.31883 Transcript_15477/m.31883 type:complete len:889 (-) Transcript_15477:24-2690(-)